MKGQNFVPLFILLPKREEIITTDAFTIWCGVQSVRTGEALLSNTKSWINWIALIGLLIIFGVGAAVWPSIAASIDLFGGSTTTQVPVESHPIEITVPVTGLPEVSLPGFEISNSVITIEPVTAVVGLTILLFGGIVVTGLIITLIYTFLDKLRGKTVDSEEYKEHVTALNNKEKEYFKEVRADRKAAGPPEDPTMPRWSAWATSILIMIFVALLGMVISLTFWPHWVEVDELADALTTPGMALISVMCLVTAIILVWRMGPQRIEKVEKSDDQGIPRDTIAVILTGLIVLGLGIGYTIYLNLP